jgi:hypothetical protein
MKNKEVIRCYRRANAMANKIYDYIEEHLAGFKTVVYAIEVNRWNNYAGVRVWVSTCCDVDADIATLLGNISRDFTFAKWRNDDQKEFISSVKDEVDAYVEKVKSIENIK